MRQSRNKKVMANNFNNKSSDLVEKLPPQNIEAEKSLLGSLLIDKNAIVKVADFLQPKDLYKQNHQNIYKAILELFEKGEPVDLLAVSTRLKEKKLLKEIGGNSYLTELINFVPTASHVSNYAKIVKRKRILRDLIEASQEINSIGYNEEEDIDILLDRAEQKIFSIAQKSLTQNFLPVKAGLEEAFERIDKLSKHQGAPRGLPTGFTDLDNILAGLQKSDLVILASRPSLGKSAMAINMAANIAINQKIPVGLFSLEMSKDQVIDRLIAGLSNVDLWKLRTGRLSSEGDDNDFARIQHTMGLLSEAPIYIDDAASSNVLQMRAMARRLQAEHGLGLIIIDYLQLMEPRNPMVNIVQQVTEISRTLKGLARELNVPVLALSQLSRAVEQRSPQIPRLADLRESGSLEQDSDVVLFIFREDRYRPDSPRKNIADIIIAKHRNGPIGSVELCIVEKETDLISIEKIKKYNGLYFVLGGTVSALKKDNSLLRIEELKERVKEPKKFGLDAVFKEIIIAINPTTEGETTALYIERALKSLQMPENKKIPKITRLGRGLPVGGELEYSDEETLRSSFEGRK